MYSLKPPTLRPLTCNSIKHIKIRRRQLNMFRNDANRFSLYCARREFAFRLDSGANQSPLPSILSFLPHIPAETFQYIYRATNRWIDITKIWEDGGGRGVELHFCAIVGVSRLRSFKIYTMRENGDGNARMREIAKATFEYVWICGRRKGVVFFRTQTLWIETRRHTTETHAYWIWENVRFSKKKS